MQNSKKTKSMAGGAGCKSAEPTNSEVSIANAHAIPASFADWLEQPAGAVEVDAQWVFQDENPSATGGTWNFSSLT